MKKKSKDSKKSTKIRFKKNQEKKQKKSKTLKKKKDHIRTRVRRKKTELAKIKETLKERRGISWL